MLLQSLPSEIHRLVTPFFPHRPPTSDPRPPTPDLRPLSSVLHPILAIDHGSARIGIAATDPLGIAAHPVETIETARTDPFERISQIIAERGVKRILLGLPLRLDGSEGDAANRVRAFGTQLAEKVPDVPLEYTDERLSTTAASEKLRAAGKSTRKHKDIIDQAAALEILNDWLAEQPS